MYKISTAEEGAKLVEMLNGLHDGIIRSLQINSRNVVERGLSGEFIYPCASVDLTVEHSNYPPGARSPGRLLQWHFDDAAGFLADLRGGELATSSWPIINCAITAALRSDAQPPRPCLKFECLGSVLDANRQWRHTTILSLTFITASLTELAAVAPDGEL